MTAHRSRLVDWASHLWRPDFKRFSGFGWIVRLVLALPLLALAIIALALIAGTIVNFIMALAGRGDFAGPDHHSEAIHDIGLVLAALVGVPFLVWRSIVAYRQVNVAEQGLITDRLNKAVEGLGAEKTVKRRLTHPDGTTEIEETTAPNIEVRIGAIYALERISRDSDRDHVNVMEILCAYIRENAPASSARNPEDDGIETPNQLSEIASVDDRKAHLKMVTKRNLLMASWLLKRENIRPPRSDVGIALAVIGRRAPDRVVLEKSSGAYQRQPSYRLDLRNTSLQLADLNERDFSEARLTGARLEGANLRQTLMRRADLIGATMDGSRLSDSNLDGANLSVAQLDGATLSRAKLSPSTKLIGTSIRGAAIKGLDFSGIWIRQEQIETAFGDGSTIIGNLQRPTHWPSADLEDYTFSIEYNCWRADPASYVPPQDRA
ncbi:hypothetical protein BYZ73_10420 [Rhodovulum viride]|uniref:Pentapeptide repeat protein n=1 Tax=Rhodovulum viride TaxID=1231134 RepID=A0ABX9DI05_9RHOB|nr:pentapeptide repeat-containing protein [Rhodovulum viride]RAP41354.1 hypothetical protein BYZ73_10420 [Rhodovulum viride]